MKTWSLNVHVIRSISETKYTALGQSTLVCWYQIVCIHTNCTTRKNECTVISICAANRTSRILFFKLSYHKGRLYFGSRQPARPVWGGRNRHFFFWTSDFVNNTFLSGRFCEQHGCMAKHVHSYKVRLSEVYVLCIVHQYTPAHRDHSCVCCVCDLDGCVAFYA